MARGLYQAVSGIFQMLLIATKFRLARTKALMNLFMVITTDLKILIFLQMLITPEQLLTQCL